MTPRPNVSDMRKDQIMNAAEDVFSQKGFDEARMEDIALATGLSKGALYLYYKSKEELIIAILDRIFQREFRTLETVDWSAMSATQVIWAFTDTTVKDIRFMQRLLPVVNEFLAMASRNKYVQQALKNYLNQYMSILLPVIQRGIETGEFRPVDAQEVAIAYGAIIEGTFLLWIYDKSLVEPARHIRSGVKLLLEGISRQSV